MSSTVDLTGYPYYDLYNRETRYTKVLPYIRGITQPRDLLEAQSILQDQLTRFADTIYKNGTIIDGCDIIVNDSKTSVTVSPGHIYLNGQIEEFLEPSVLTITGSGLEIIGLVKTEEVITDTEDLTLKNPATNFDKYDAAGSYRLKITWTWAILTDDNPGIPALGKNITSIVDGVSSTNTTITLPDTSQTIFDKVISTIAGRDYAQYGNYILEGLQLKVTDHPQYPQDMKQVTVTAGTARILGKDIILSNNWIGSVPVARDTQLIQNEQWTYTNYDSLYRTGGQKELACTPVNSVSSVVATILVVDGYGDTPYVTRGTVAGGADSISEPSLVEIIAVNQGGEWNPTTESFEGGVTFNPSTYTQMGNKVSWSPVGVEPSIGTTYSVAYKSRQALTKQIMEATLVENEPLIKDAVDILSHPYVCESNAYTGLEVIITNELYPDITSSSDYQRSIDFEILEDGTVDWYDHQTQEISVLRASNVVTDTIDLESLSYDYVYESCLGVASLDAFFNPVPRIYISGTKVYQPNIDYYLTLTETSLIVTWILSPESSIPTSGDYYKIALLVKKPKTDYYPEAGNTYYVTYNYWNVAIPGDYIARDSFYISYDATDFSQNQIQHYGLDLQNSVNFWKSFNYENNLNNMRKPYPNTTIDFFYNYYLSRYALVKYLDTGTVDITLGSSFENPTEPMFDESTNLLLLGTVYLPADGLNATLHEFNVKSYKMLKLRELDTRLGTVEKDLADTWLDLQAKDLFVSNKQGITTTSFRDSSRLDPGWIGSSYAIDPDWECITLPHNDEFVSTDVSITFSTGTNYDTVCTLTPVGVNVISQDSYTDTISLAPTDFANVQYLQTSQSASTNLYPSGDLLTIPFVSGLMSTDDYGRWINSDLVTLNDPAAWFTGGWRGGQTNNSQISSLTTGSNQTTIYSNTTKDWTSEITKNIQGFCRQRTITFNVVGLPKTSDYQLDFSVYFGGIRVPVTVLNGTPHGVTAGSFRPKDDKTAMGQFTIPYGVAPGQIEVKIISSSMIINSTEWRFVSTATYMSIPNSSVVNNLNNCRCNCYACNRCANCWTCTGRCGTGPISQTINLASSTSRVLKSLDIDYYSVSSRFGVTASVVSTENGQPTSGLIANNMLGRKYLSPSSLAGAGLKSYVFNDPIFLNANTYAFLLTGEDGFNINATSEVAAGRDIRVKTATVGGIDLYTKKLVNNQQFNTGTMWRSVTGNTWLESDTSDLKFRATFNVYPTNVSQTIQMAPISVNNATSFICAWNSSSLDSTNITFQYSVGDGSWYEFSPFVLTDLPRVSNTITVKALLTSYSSAITPYVENYCSFYVQSRNTDMLAVTSAFNLTENEYSDTIDVWVNSHLPVGFSQKLRITFDNGITWVDLNQEDGGLTGLGYVVTLVNVVPINLNVGQETYTYHWNVTLPIATQFQSFRTEFNLNSLQDLELMNLERPWLANYIAIPSTI